MIIRINTIKGVNMNKDYENNCGLDLSGCKVFRGKDIMEKVFLMEDGKVIKICTTVRSCKSEYLIFKKSKWVKILS